MADFQQFRRAYAPGSTVTHEPAADGWPLRVFRWPATNARGSILFQGGRGDIIEKYLESFAHWHAQGWSIIAFDWRGQGGSGRLAVDPLVGHVSDFAVWIDDLAAFATAWRRTAPPPHVGMGHSMGGHLILRAIGERRIKLDGAVLIAPMLGFETGVVPIKLAAALVRLAARVAPERLAWRTNERPGASKIGRQTFLTSDQARYEDELWWKRERPELALGPPSLRWLEQAYRSCLALPGRIGDATTPMLILASKGDKLVSPAAIAHVATLLGHARLRMFDADVAHEILRERDAVLDQALAEIDRFLDETKARA